MLRKEKNGNLCINEGRVAHSLERMRHCPDEFPEKPAVNLIAGDTADKAACQTEIQE